MATVQTLKDKDDNTFYPVTKTEAVYNADGTESLDTTIVNVGNILATKATVSDDVADANKMMKADGTKALVGTSNIDGGAVTTAKLDDGAVTSSKLDWTTLDTGWVSLVDQTGFSVRYRKIGRVVYVWGRSDGVKTIPANASYNYLATLPEGCRPAGIIIEGFVSLIGGDQSVTRFMHVLPGGNVEIYNGGGDSAFSYWSFNESFPAD